MKKKSSDITPLPIRDLGNGLILRRSTIEDAEPLAEFNARIHGNPKDEWEQKAVADWTRDLLSGHHPTHSPNDFTLVENVQTKQIVSTLNLIPQTWSYAGIPFGVGRPELVGTDPDYRNRGYIRMQFEVIHEWSRQRGHLVQGITGIPYYYRLFGYEMAMNLGGNRKGFTPPPAPAPDQPVPFSLRPAHEADVPFLLDMFKLSVKRSLVSCVWDEVLLRYELSGKMRYDLSRRNLWLIETTSGERAGFLAVAPILSGTSIYALSFELLPGYSWLDATPVVLRHLWEIGQGYAVEHKKTCDSFVLELGSEHPAYQAAGDRLPIQRPPYAWYIRVADLPGFLLHIKPVLENRLETSNFSGFSGELKISFYRNGIRMAFDNGKLSVVEAWTPAPKEGQGDCAFPALTFLQMVFGFRTLDELRYAFPDCWANDRAQVVLPILFPKQASCLWQVG